MKKFQSINPFTNEVIEEFESLSEKALMDKLALSEASFEAWRLTSFEERALLLTKVSEVLRANSSKYARSITLEMGKPFKESLSEIEKCAWVCEYYAENGMSFLKDEIIETDANKSYVKYQPIGAVLAIMPWNFPFWQVFRFAVPALMAGNVGILKHAPNVFRCATQIEAIFLEAGVPKGVFQSVVIDVDLVEKIVSHPAVKAVTLTGSEKAGASVASFAGKEIKKSVLELGGSNGFVVLDDADVKSAVTIGLLARMQNSGQSCIAAKRFFLHKQVAVNFLEQYVSKVRYLKVGDPFDEKTIVGPLARIDLAEKLEDQVNRSVAAGAKVEAGGKRENAFYYPTVLTNVRPGMPAFDEELFGPVAAFTVIESDEEALQLANRTRYGLGLTVFTSSQERAEYFINHSQDGAVFINGMVKSDPRLPFGGTKHSGYGRELSIHGIREFVNAKTVQIKWS